MALPHAGKEVKPEDGSIFGKVKIYLCEMNLFLCKYRKTGFRENPKKIAQVTWTEMGVRPSTVPCSVSPLTTAATPSGVPV